MVVVCLYEGCMFGKIHVSGCGNVGLVCVSGRSCELGAPMGWGL